MASYRRRSDILRSLTVCTAGIASALVLATSAGAGSNAGVPRGWHRADLLPVTQPAAIDGNFVFYDGSRRRLNLVALDARTGKTVWSKLASLSDVTPGVAPALDVAGANVIALLREPGGDQEATVSTIDARTGRIVWASAPGRFTSMPVPCPGEPKVVCVTGSLKGGGAIGGLRFDLATGRTLAPATVDSGARELGWGLLDPGLRNPDYLIAVRGSAIAWRLPLARIFGPGSTSDYGWNLGRDDKLGLFVGSVSYPPLKETKAFTVVDVSKEMTAGFRIANGSVVWRNRGALFACGLLPCAGDPLAGYVKQGQVPTSKKSVGLRLRMSGKVRVTPSLKFTVSPDATVALEGFDPANGRTLWSFDAGRSLPLITHTAQPPQTGKDRIVLADRKGAYVDLNLRTGARHKVARTTRAWCRSAISYPQAVAYVATHDRVYRRYIGQASLFACDATGRRLPTPARVPPVAGEIGASSDGIVAWSDKTGVIAVPAS